METFAHQRCESFVSETMIIKKYWKRYATKSMLFKDQNKLEIFKTYHNLKMLVNISKKYLVWTLRKSNLFVVSSQLKRMDFCDVLNKQFMCDDVLFDWCDDQNWTASESARK